MKYEDIISILLKEFPVLKDKYEKEKDYLENLPYLCFEIIFVQYIKNMCVKSCDEELYKIGNFIERGLLCHDKKISELIVVAVLESLIVDREIIAILKKYMLRATNEEVLRLEKYYGWIK